MVGDLLSAGFTFVDRRVGQRAYSRKLESEADTLGLEVSSLCTWALRCLLLTLPTSQLMAKAGFDPRGAVTLWEILTEVEEDVTATGEHGTITDHIALLRTHPTGEQRLSDLRNHLPGAIKLFEQSKKDRKAMEAVKAAMKEVAAQEEANMQLEREGKGGTPAGLAGEVTV